MKKASKILTLILIVVFVLSVFAGCDLIGRDVAKYREADVIQIGDETITIGKLLDTFNSYYNQYYYYISAGYLDAEYLLEMTLSSLIGRYIQVDDYVKNNAPTTPALKGKAHNAEYLTEDEFEYAIQYVRYYVYQAFDQYIEDKITSKYDLNAAETEDTSRDFSESDDLKGAQTYAEYLYKQNFLNEDAEEYFAKYYPSDITFDTIDAEGYIYAPASEFAQKRVDEYNERRTEDEEEELTVEEYIEMQQDTLKQYGETVENNYGISLDEFLEGQLNDLIVSCIVAKWNYKYYENLEKEDEFVETLTNNFNTLRDSQLKGMEINDSFDTFIKGLSSGSYIYGDEGIKEKAHDYVFVKNVLIPFTTEQTNRLTNLSNTLGTKDDERYTLKRDEEATRIKADYFYSDKYEQSIEDLFASFLTENEDEDADSKYEKLEGIFTTDANNKLVVNSEGILGGILSNGQVNAIGDLSKEQTIIELMKRFNTDIGQHTSQYDYVVYVGDDENYTHNWVSEFVDATKEALEVNNGEAGGYALGVSDYGVHIVYVVGYVDDYMLTEYDYSKHLDTETAYYRLFKSYFETQISLRTSEASNELLKKYLEDGKVTVKAVFEDFLKENNFTFDFDEFVADLKKEL